LDNPLRYPLDQLRLMHYLARHRARWKGSRFYAFGTPRPGDAGSASVKCIAAKGPALAALLADLTQRGARIRLEVRGRSMRPLLRDGDCVTVAGAEAGSLRRGDLILFRTDTGQLLLHRIRTVARGARPRFYTRGDSSETPDRPIGASNIVGRVIRVDYPARHGLHLMVATDQLCWKAASLLVLAYGRVRRLRSALQSRLGARLARG
jgi:signal peptidase I